MDYYGPSCLVSQLFDIAHLLSPRTAFGFASSLLESIPFVGLFFAISNQCVISVIFPSSLSDSLRLARRRIGSAMFAHDLEKRQGAFRDGKLEKRKRVEVVVVPGVGEKGRVGIRSEIGGGMLLGGEKEMIPGAL